MIDDSDVLEAIVRGAFDSMRNTGPKRLLALINFMLEGRELDELELARIISIEDLNSAARKSAHFALSMWDAEANPTWSDTEPRTVERRQSEYECLQLGLDSRLMLDAAFPIASQRDTIISKPAPWDPWYSLERQAAHDFYWRAYSGVLEAKRWPPETIASLDVATSDIIGRLADPSAPTQYQSKGLVVGYVQSGKTANFTGIVAKAIDSGYRLIIVLTGTIELLRGQTQRRLDMELVGEENILGGRDRADPDAVRDVDYIGSHDADWEDNKFLRHGVDINRDPNIPSIKRLTSASRDYRKLGAGLDTLDFRRTGELRDPSKPIFDAVNIHGTDVRLAVMKKNPTALRALIRDLQDVHADSREIPTLIIDDEADQASINTTNPNRPGAADDAKKRTTINGLISQLLGLMPRAQYLGYTATPFANVFVSPDDAADIFPRDFIVSLEPSSDYVGGKQFHDLVPVAPEIKNPSTSNEAAFVRSLIATTDSDERQELQQAIDAFVLTGAIKRWRSSVRPSLVFRHHTMLIHQSVRQDEHRDLADLVKDVWDTSEYSGAGSLARLRLLFETDFRVVHDARQWELPFPDSFDSLKSFVAETVTEILADGSPVVIVNGSRDSDYDAMDFQRRPYWRIMIGGAKLSRGFTVEGLTVSYYRRRASAADTLMQMGRWFGYRPGYRDLVRLYIGRDVIDGHGRSFDLYDMFTAILQDEDEFRGELRAFSEKDDEGRPMIIPRNVPPMVFAQLSWLRPSGTNRMYNAVLTEMARGGKVMDKFAAPLRSENKHAANLRRLLTLVDPGGPRDLRETNGGLENVFRARVSVRSAAEVLDVFRSLQWSDARYFQADLGFMINAIKKGTLTDWAIIVPDLASSVHRPVVDLDNDLPVIQRKRRPVRNDFSGSDPKHRGVLQFAAGMYPQDSYEDDREPALAGDGRTRAAMLLNFAYESETDYVPVQSLDPIDPADVVGLITIAYPYWSAPRGRIAFQVRDDSRPDEAIVDLD